MKQPGDEDRILARGNYIIPCLLHNLELNHFLNIKAVLLDISGSGCRAFTNDPRVGRLGEELLKGMNFKVEFDFYEIDTNGITGKIVNILPGRNIAYEWKLGIHFTTIKPIIIRDINRRVVTGINNSS